MRKIVLLDDYFPTGEQTVQPVMLWGPSHNRFDLSRVTKTASEAVEYIKHVTPEPGKTHLLLLAMGGEETYGPNRNGDGFPERPIAARDGRGFYVAPGEELTKHYQTFETNPAHAFQHHVNKDPRKASGHVKKAFWNDRMHRVELLVIIDNQKDPEWVQRVNDGDFPPVSMGCRIKYDVCSVCGNKAPTRAQYCDHVTRSPGMNRLMPDGRRAYVHNPSPNFFDISRVFRPADRTGYTLKKVAHVYELQLSAELGETADDLERKSAAIRKLSDIDKIIRGEPIASSSNLAPKEQVVIKHFRDHVANHDAAPELPVDDLLSVPPASALSTLSGYGMQMNTPEFLRWYASVMRGQPTALPADAPAKVAALLPTVFAMYERAPALLDDVLKLGMLDHQLTNDGELHIDDRIAARLRPLMVKRASTGEMLYRRLIPEGIGLRPDEGARTDLLQAPGGLTTTRGAAIDAQDAQTRAGWKGMLGSGALMLGAYKMLGAFPSLRPFRLPGALAAGYLGHRAFSPSSARIPTDQGYGISPYTEFGVRTGEENIAGTVVDLVDNYKLARGLNRADFAFERLKNASWHDDVRGVEIDFDSAAETLGELISS